MACLNVKVVPGSSHSEIVGWLGDALKIKVPAPPEQPRGAGKLEVTETNHAPPSG